MEPAGVETGAEAEGCGVADDAVAGGLVSATEGSDGADDCPWPVGTAVLAGAEPVPQPATASTPTVSINKTLRMRFPLDR